MKKIIRAKLAATMCAGLFVLTGSARAQNIFIDLQTGTAAPTNTNIAAPTGYSFSAAAPVAGSNWNTVGESSTVPLNTTVGSTVITYSNLPLNNSTGASISPTLTVSFFSAVTTGTRVEPSNASGENTIQPSGVMQQAWRNFFNGSGSYFTYTFSGLTPSILYGIYLEGGTTTSGQGAGVALSNGNYYAASSGNPTNAVTTNTVQNSNGAFGSLFTSNGAGGFQLMPQGMTWTVLYGQSDASGNFSFLFNGAGNGAYLNGFQLVPLSAPGLSGPTNQTIIAGNNATFSASATGLPAPALQWQTNGVNIVGATSVPLILTNVQYSQNGYAYSLIASNIAGVVTNSMTLTVIVTPTVTGLTNQAVTASNNVTVAASVTGVPAPALQWQFNGTNLTDGATGNGSTITGSANSSLGIASAQPADSGTYCLIASNAAGVATNCMTLTVSGGSIAPSITGPTDQTVVAGNNATFSASVSGLPVPTLQWQENGANLAGATGSSLILTNVPFAKDGFVYSIIASNSAGVATNSATLHVLVPSSISSQPQSLVVTNTQAASFSVTAAGVPTPTYQWLKNNSPIANATNSTLTIASAQPSDMATYDVVVSNVVSSVTSSNATLTVNSTMTAVSLAPTNGATAVCYDTPLYITFDQPPLLNSTGKIRIYSVTNSVTPVDTLDMSLNVTLNVPYAVNEQPRTIATETYNSFPVIITNNLAAIYPHLDLLSSNQTYYVTVDNGVFTDTNGALFVGIAGSNTWQFTTKPTGPLNPTNIVVAADGSGDFVTVQGAIDFVPNNKTTPTLINIRNGTYTEIVDIHTKNNITFRGQSRNGTVIAYANNGNLNASTHFEDVFKVNGNDIAVDNLTLNDTSGVNASPAQALMLETNIKRFILNNAEVDGYQDTILANTSGTQAYFNNSLVQGSVDYIWGGGNMFITNCEFRTLRAGGNITQARTDPFSNGMSFVNCQITRNSNGVNNCTLGRAISIPSGNVVYVSCRIDTNCIIGWNGTDPSISRYWEYGNSNLTATAAVSYNGTILTNGDPNLANAQSAPLWLYGWQPQLSPNILTNPVSVTVTAGVSATFSVAATGIPDPTYQWLVNGTNFVGGNSATLTISNALAGNAGIYAVIVSNSAGAVTSSNATLTVVGTGPSASFTASPTSGTEPLAVTFTDTSSGSPNISLFWNLGDATTTNLAGGSTLVHSYAAGIYTVTLTASNAFGANSTIVSNNLINVITAFQAWQLQYFGCTNCANAAANADPLGKGMSNFDQFLAGINPTNPASALRITSVMPSGSNVVITWTTAGGHTNVVQANAGDGNGGYTTNFTDLSGSIVITGSGDAITNYTDAGGATNRPSRYYRVRLAP